MFFLTFEATPKPSSAHYGEADGAFVSCWANEPTAKLAEAGARAMADAYGWDVISLDECREVVREEYVEYPDRLEHFDQAITDGLVLTFHLWPIGGDREYVGLSTCRLTSRCSRRAAADARCARYHLSARS